MNSSVDSKTILITGGNSGIGYETARALGKAGARVILTSRSAARAEAAADRIASESGCEAIGLELDFSALANVNAFADNFPRRFDRIDVLVNNAGALFRTRKESVDGIELTWAANHLGPFLLTARLLPLLKRAEGARIVTTASSAHKNGSIDFDDLGLRRHYTPFSAYGRSKLGNILFTFGLARRLEGTGITANCLHPGVVATGFFRFVPAIGLAAQWLFRPFLRSPQKGAETAVFLAVDDSMAGVSGGYYFDKHPIKTSTLAADVALQDRVWALSIEQTGAVWEFGGA
jgi:NAD(P)-dependent dehydrogenase (short-subunit alcohol dehydrogenase family)